MDGATAIANDYADLRDGGLQNALFLNENGQTPVSDPNYALYPYTGTNTAGTAYSSEPLGVASDGLVHAAASQQTNGYWISGSSGYHNNTEGSYYAMSDPLTVTSGIPEPASLALLALAGTLVLRRRP